MEEISAPNPLISPDLSIEQSNGSDFYNLISSPDSNSSSYKYACETKDWDFINTGPIDFEEDKDKIEQQTGTI